MRYGKIALIIVLTFGVTDFFDATAYARRGGGFRSSSSRSTSTRSSSWGSSTRRTTTSRTSKWRSSTSSSAARGSRSQAQTPRRTAADQKLYEKAQASGTAFSSKSAATTAFKSKYGSKYTARFDSRPATRPDYIPQSTLVGGRTYNIQYNRQYGGYGYMGPSRTWIMYDAMADAVMLNSLMSRNYYYYDRPRTVYVGSVESSAILLWTGVVCLGLILAFAVYLVATE